MAISKKKCLLTGYPGYLGSRLYNQFQNEYEIYTLGLEDADTKKHAVADISQKVPQLDDIKYDLVIHAAGKAHIVPKTPEEEESFFRVNERGTYNLLGALDELTHVPAAFVLISTVAVYGQEVGNKITEHYPLNATDPYGLSKIKAEAALTRWDQTEVVKGIVRLPLIFGKNPPGNLGNMISSIKKGVYFNVSGGKARRSFVWIDDIAAFIVELVKNGGGTYNMTDGHDASFKELYETFCRIFHRRKYPALPKCIAVPLALTGDAIEGLTHKKIPFNSYVLKKMTTDLTFSSEKARRDFNWKPTKVLDRIADLM